MIAVWWYYLLSGMMIGIIVWLLTKQNRLEEDLANKAKALDYAEKSLSLALRNYHQEKKTSAEIVNAVLPLVEKTDWMTGRWGGQFSTLVRMENARNSLVDVVQRRIMALASVNSLPVKEKMAILGGAGEGAFSLKALQDTIPRDYDDMDRTPE